MSEYKIGFEGKPTGPDINNIIKRYPIAELTPGKVILHSDIEEIIHETRDKHRYRTVIQALRKRLDNECNIHLIAIKDGYEVGDNSQRINVASNRVRSGLRKVVRGGNLAMRTGNEGLTIEESKIRDHLTQLSGQIHTIAAVESRKLKYEIKGLEQKVA